MGKKILWKRGNKSLVAVNPERITTLYELAVEYYGEQCARCNAVPKPGTYLVVHHRHYRTIGFEKPVEDIVLLCGQCHTYIHFQLGKERPVRQESPYLDPRLFTNEKSKDRKFPEDERFKGVYRTGAGRYTFLIFYSDKGDRFAMLIFKILNESLEIGELIRIIPSHLPSCGEPLLDFIYQLADRVYWERQLDELGDYKRHLKAENRLVSGAKRARRHINN